MSSAFLFVDGFESYPDVHTTPQGLQACWAFPPSANLTELLLCPGRFGGAGVQVNSFGAGCGFGRPVAAGTTFAVGFAYNFLGPTAPNVSQSILALQIANGANSPSAVDVVFTTNQTFALRVAGVVVATSTVLVPAGGWHFVELVATLAASGSLALYLDGILVASFNGNTGGAACSFICFGSVAGGQGVSFQFDDVYATSTAVRVGERRVQTLVPIAAGAVTQWTPLANANWQEVAALPVRGDAAYVNAAAVGTTDLYAMAALSGTPVAISTVQVRVCARKDDAATRELASVLKSGAAQVNGTPWALSGTYQYGLDLYDVDPNTGAAWTAAGVDAAQIGQTVIV